MIEQSLYEHLIAQESLEPYLTRYNDVPAVFNQEAPPDSDRGWDEGSQYGRIVFAVDLQGDPERIMSGTLSVDIMCHEEEQAPEEIEPVVRSLIHGWFFSRDTFTVAAQWKNSAYFTQVKDHVVGCTITFELLGFPVLGSGRPDLIRHANHWTREAFKGVHVINHDPLPYPAWKPSGHDSAVYWRLMGDKPAGWIRDTYATVWRTGSLKCHVFSEDLATAAELSRAIAIRLHAAKRWKTEEDGPIIVNRGNRVDDSADPLRTGQVTVEATYGVIVHFVPDDCFNNINY